MSDPNSKNEVILKNEWGGTIEHVVLGHRYDTDWYDRHSWPSIENGGTGTGMQVRYWTGIGRTGYDYWHISFTADNAQYACKENFYCFLTSDDAESKKPVTVRVRDGSLHIEPPRSSACTVSLQRVG